MLQSSTRSKDAVTPSRTLSPPLYSAVLNKKIAIDKELETYREQQLVARAETDERVHASKLVLQVCADMLIAVSEAVSSAKWDEVWPLQDILLLERFRVRVHHPVIT